MAKKYLGDTIDIHAGGEDLQFPHHENEIAQSECCNGKVFANYWMHNEMINIDNVKMSKSKGNFFTIKDIQKEYDLEVIRLWILSTHYERSSRTGWRTGGAPTGAGPWPSAAWTAVPGSAFRTSPGAWCIKNLN